MIRLLHLADVHLDASFAGSRLGGDIARRYRAALRETFVQILELARSHKVDAVTVGGDLYEQEHFSPDTGQFLLEQFRQLEPIRVFLAPGNHDPFVVDSLYNYLRWPGNVTVFTEETFQPVELGEGWTLWGMAHRTVDFRKNPLEKLKLPEKGRHVLLFHGSDETKVPRGKKAHAPFRPEQVAQTGARALLTGHYHRGKSWQENGALIVYPGSPEPLGFGEEGFHGVALVTLDESGISMEMLKTNRHEFVQGELDVSAATSSEQVKQLALQWAEAHAGDRNLLRLILRGEIRPEVDIRPETIAEALAGRFFSVKVLDQTQVAFDLERLALEKTVRGEFVRTMLQRIESAPVEEKPRLENALRFGLRAFERGELMVE